MRLWSPEVATLSPFAEELPHLHALDAAQGIHVLATPRSPKLRLSLGCAWLLEEPLNLEVLDEAECLLAARQHEGLLRILPVGSAVQVLCLIVPSMQAPRWEAQRQEVAETLPLQAQRQAIRQGLMHGHGQSRGRLRAMPTVVTLRVPVDATDLSVRTIARTLLRHARRLGTTALDQWQTALARHLLLFRGLRQGVEDTLVSIGHRCTPLDSEGLGQHLARMLHPCAPTLPMIVPEHPLREQVLEVMPETCVGGWRFGAVDTHGVFTEQYGAQVLSLHRATRQTYPGMLSATRAPVGSRPLALWQAWDGPMAITANLAVMDQAKEEMRLQLKSLIAGAQALLSARNAALKRELNELEERQFLTGSLTGWGRLHLTLYGPTNQLQRGMDEVRRTAQRLRLAFAPEPDLGSTLFLQTLPLGCDPDFPSEKALRRARRVPLENLLQMLPLYGSTRGTTRASVLYLNQRGEEVGFNPFDSPTNPHVIITGTSGAGKTYTVGHYLNHLLSLGGMAVLIDPLKNYRTLCAALGGEHCLLTFEHPPCINPFWGPLNDAHKAFASASLAEMASGGVERLSWEEFNVLAHAVTYFMDTWDRGRGEPTMTPFAEEVLETGAFNRKDRRAVMMGMQLARKLRLFYGGGVYAKFVDGPNTFRLTNRLTLIELSELHESEALQGILFLLLLHPLTQRFQDPTLAGVSKSLIVDEVWSPLKYEVTAGVIEKVVRTYRNMQTSAVFLSQRAEDFDSPTGRVIRGIADTVLFLQQTSSDMTQLTSLFQLTPAEQDLFQYVGRQSGYTSGYLRVGERRGGIVRIVADLATDFCMSQEESMRRLRAQVQEEAGGDMAAGMARWLTQQLSGGVV